MGATSGSSEKTYLRVAETKVLTSYYSYSYILCFIYFSPYTYLQGGRPALCSLLESGT